MRGKTVIFLLFILGLLSYSQKKDIGYIEVNLNQGSLIDDFFEVYLSEDMEEVYLDFFSIMNYFDLKENITVSKDIIRVTLPKSRSKNKKLKKEITKVWKIDKNKVIRTDEELYIHYKEFKEIIPLEKLEWNIEENSLNIIGNFYIIGEISKIRERQKKNLSKEISGEEVILITNEKEKIINPGIVIFKYSYGDFFDGGKGVFGFKYGTRVAHGDFKLEGSIYPVGRIDYKNLKYNSLVEGKLLELGDVYFNSSGNLHKNEMLEGVVLNNKNFGYSERKDLIELEGYIEDNGVAELYKDDIMYQYSEEENNRYKIEIPLFEATGTYVLKLYSSSGKLLSEKPLNLSGRNEMIPTKNIESKEKYLIRKKRFDYNFGIARNKENDDLSYMGEIGYGISENLTYKGSIWDTVLNTGNYVKKNYLTNTVIYNPVISKIPFSSKLTSYNLINDFSSNLIEIDSRVTLKGGTLQLFHENYTKELKELFKKERVTNLNYYNSFKGINYGLSFGYENSKTEESFKNKYTSGIDFSKSFNSFRSSVSIDYKDVDNEWDMEFLNTYAGKIHLYSTSVKYNKNNEYDDLGLELNLSKKRVENSKFSYSAKAGYSKRDEFYGGISFTYYFKDLLELGYEFVKDKDGVENSYAGGLNYEQAINLSKPFKRSRSKDVDRAFIEGNVFLDKNGNSKLDRGEKLLKGVEIKVADEKIKTDKKGYYYLDNIKPYQEHELELSYDSLDPNLRIEATKFKLKAGLGKKYNIPVHPMFSVSGFINLDERLDEEESRKLIYSSKVELYKNGKKLKEIIPELEGFYMINDLLPGSYSLKVKYDNSNKYYNYIENKNNIINFNLGETIDDFKEFDINIKLSELPKKEEEFIF